MIENFPAFCNFSYEFEDGHSMQQREVVCNRSSSYKPSWYLTENHTPLPPCVYKEEPCSTDKLSTITNSGFSSFKRNGWQYTSIHCKKEGYVLSYDDTTTRLHHEQPLYGSHYFDQHKCFSSVELYCKEGKNGAGDWTFPFNNQTVDASKLSCQKGMEKNPKNLFNQD